MKKARSRKKLATWRCRLDWLQPVSCPAGRPQGRWGTNQILKALKRCTEVSPELKQLTKKARRAADFLKALAHEKRLLILCALAERERSVTELEILLSLSQSTVSQHLARLRYDGLVDTRRKWRTVYYSLADDTTLRFIDAIYGKFCRT